MSTVLAPRELLLEAGAFRYADLHGLRSSGACDWEMWLLLALRGVRFHYVDEPLAMYRSTAFAHGRRAVGDRPPVAVFRQPVPEVRGRDRRLLRRERRRWR